MTKRRKVIFNNATRRTSENMEKFFVASWWKVDDLRNGTIIQTLPTFQVQWQEKVDESSRYERYLIFVSWTYLEKRFGDGGSVLEGNERSKHSIIGRKNEIRTYYSYRKWRWTVRKVNYRILQLRPIWNSEIPKSHNQKRGWKFEKFLFACFVVWTILASQQRVVFRNLL